MNRRFLPLVCVLLIVAACGQQSGSGGPTALPAGTRVAQPTPDFSAPRRGDTATTTVDRVAETIRSRLAQRRGQADLMDTPTTAAQVRPTQAAPRSRADLSVFSQPTALGILSGGSPLYAAPGGGAIVPLRVGATLTITGRSADGGWFAAYLEDGTAGWVPVSQVRVFGDSDALEIVQESIGPAVVATLIAEASEPLAPIGTVVARPTAATGSASAEATPEPAQAEVSPATSTGPFVTCLVRAANVRAGPGTDFPIVGGLFQGEQAALLARNQSGDWAQVELPEGIGWIFAQLVETSVPIGELPVVESGIRN